MKAAGFLTLAILGTLATVPGCIFVAKSDRSGRTYARNDLATQIEPGQPLPGVRERRRDDLARLSPGMSTDEFRRVFGDAVFIESRSVGTRQWQAFSVIHTELCQLAGAPSISHRDEVWFFFEDGQYRGFGPARQWPSDASISTVTTSSAPTP